MWTSKQSEDRGPAVRFLHVLYPVIPQHSDAAVDAADPEAGFNA
jgi:hypothetical protein